MNPMDSALQRLIAEIRQIVAKDVGFYNGDKAECFRCGGWIIVSTQQLDEWADQLDALLVRPSREWQPISTAPKDGTRILVCVPNPPCKGDEIQTAVYNRYSHPRATHWMPLPAPPGLAREEQTDKEHAD